MTITTSYVDVTFRPVNGYSPRETYCVNVDVLFDVRTDRPAAFIIDMYDTDGNWCNVARYQFDDARDAGSLIDQVVDATLELVNRGRSQGAALEYAGREEEESYAWDYVRRLF